MMLIGEKLWIIFFLTFIALYNQLKQCGMGTLRLGGVLEEGSQQHFLGLGWTFVHNRSRGYSQFDGEERAFN